MLEALNPNPDVDFEIPTPKSILAQICAEKVKVFFFAWKLA